jgi:hypothetical protein
MAVNNAMGVVFELKSKGMPTALLITVDRVIRILIVPQMNPVMRQNFEDFCRVEVPLSETMVIRTISAVMGDIIPI